MQDLNMQNLPDLQPLADSAIALFRQAMPWLAQTAAATVVTKGVEELWDLAKSKLSSPGGQEAIEKATAAPDKDHNWETLRNLLLDAMEEDEAFRSSVARLLPMPTGSPTNQTAIGSGIKQALVQNSPGTKIDF